MTSAVEKLLSQSSNDEKTVSFKIPEDERNNLDDVCKDNGINRSKFVLAAVRDAMNKIATAQQPADKAPE